jgi:hypothetical protein
LRFKEQTRHARRRRGDSFDEIAPPKVSAGVAGGLSAGKMVLTGQLHNLPEPLRKLLYAA